MLRFHTWALYLGDDIRVSRQRFYGNDINDLHLFICPFPFPFVPGTLDHWGGLRSNRAHTRYPATCTFTSSSSSSSSSIPLFSTLGRLQDQTRITTIPHITCTRPTDKCPLLRGTTGTGRTYSVTYHHRLLGCHDVRNTPLTKLASKTGI